jgi:uncharacterized membrane protein
MEGMQRRNFRLFWATIASYGLLSSFSLPSVTIQGQEFHLSQVAHARRSGGRSSGGSFRRSTSPSNNSSGSRPSNSSPTYRGGGSSVYVAPSYGSSSSSASGFVLLLVALLVVGGIGTLVWLIIMDMKGKPRGELDNDKVTISKVQVALLAEGRAIQSQLSEIVANADTETPEGLHQELQEAILALLRMPENWSHVLASSETVKSREEAEAILSKTSIAERSHFSTETLTNVGGKITKKEVAIDPDKEPASYIVVTLLIGTADDKPLFGEVRTVEALKETLEKLSAINSDYLMVFELLWSPQDEKDSLSYDEMLTEYTGMLQI